MSSKIFRLVFNFISSLKSVNDKVTILNAIKSAAENQIQGCKSHFIFAGDIFWNDFRLRPVVIEGMKKYNINSAMVSILSSFRNNITTKEKVEDHFKGKYQDEKSIHDDLDSFFERLCLGEEPNETVRTYFFPKLSEKETNLFETKDEEFMRTLANQYDLERIGNEQDIELAHSWSEFDNTYESKWEYIKSLCSRRTFLIHKIKNYANFEFLQPEPYSPNLKIRKMNN